MVISSAAGSEYAFESDTWKNGVFTYSVLEGLKNQNADLDGDGKVMVSELGKYLGKRVRDLTSGRQSPTFRRDILEFDFSVR